MTRIRVFLILLCLYIVPAAWAQTQVQSSLSTRNVSGTRIGHYKDGAFPIDLTGRVAAYVPDGWGGYTTITGTGRSDGTFTILNVPYGYYLLQLGGRYIWTNRTFVNGDYDASWRSTSVTAGPDTTLTLDLFNLQRWQATDVLELVDPNAAAFQSFSATEGQVELTGTFPYTGVLNDSTLGDKTYFLQLGTQYFGGYPLVVAARYFSPNTFIQPDGTDTSLTGRMWTINPTRRFRANINGADLAAETLAANPSAQFVSTLFAVDVFQGSLAKGWTGAAPDLVGYAFTSDVPFLTVNADLGDVMYGNPFPPVFQPFVLYQYSAQTYYLAPSATNSAAITTGVYGNTTVFPTAFRPIQPMVGAVGQVSINGGDFFSSHSGIGLTPTLAWQRPKTGVAHIYSIAVWQLSNNEGDTEVARIARLQTQSTRLTIPAGLLSSDQAYVFQITAIYRPGVDVAAEPFTLGPVAASADVISGMMQP